VASEGVRLPFLHQVAEVSLRWLISRISPFQAILRPLFFIAFLLCVLAAAGSGYRNAVASVGLMLLFGVFYYHGVFAMIASCMAGAVLIGVLAGINVVAPLPGTIQRALSPFPGTWEQQYRDAAEDSTE